MLCKRLIPAVLLFAIIGAALAQDPPKLPPNRTISAGQIATQLVKLTRAWLDGSLNAGGLSADFREVSKSHENGKVKAVYRVYGKGDKPGTLYNLLSWPIEAKEPTELVKGASVTSHGLLVCGGHGEGQCGSAKSPDDPIKFTLTPRKGEITRLALVTPDKATKATLGIIPDPIVASDRGCSIEVVRLGPNFEVAMVLGKGFKPGDPIEFGASSYSESQGGPITANEKGEVVAGLTPYVKGHSSGTTSVKFTASHCEPATSFRWGK